MACGVPPVAEAPLAALAPAAPAAAGAAPLRDVSACATCVLRGAAAAEVLLAFDIGTHGPAGLACVRTHSPEPEYRVPPPPLVAQPEEVCAPAMPANAASAAAIATALRRCADGGLNRFIIIVAVLSKISLQKVQRHRRLWRRDRIRSSTTTTATNVP